MQHCCKNTKYYLNATMLHFYITFEISKNKKLNYVMQNTFILILLIWFSVPSFLIAQSEKECTYAIEGRVFDSETNEPVVFVNVQIKHTTRGTSSDETGYFKIDGLCKKEYDLVFSYLGYKTLTHHHDFHHPFLEIYMAPDKYLLESIVVEAKANQSALESISLSKISTEQLENTASESLGEVVSQIPGISTLRTGQNIVKPIIHGLHSNRILMINNGLRHEFQNWGEDHAAEIDLSNTKEIEVVKGAATVRFGPDALGGVILTNPHKMKLSTPLEGKFRLMGRSNGQTGHSALELRKGLKRFSFMGGGAYTKQGDLRAPNYFLTNTGKEEKSYYGGFRIHPFAELDIEGYYSHVDQKLGILSGSVFGNLDDIIYAISADTPLYTKPFSYDIGKPRQETQHDLYKATVKYTGKNNVLKAVYGHQINQRKEFGVRRVDAPNIDLRLVSQSLDVDWSHQNLLGLSGRLGVQLLKKANDNLPGTNTVPFIPNYDEKRVGIYLIESKNIGKHSLEMGIRYDYMNSFITGREPDNTIYNNEVVYKNFSGTIGIKAQLSEHITFQTNLGTAWRAPNVAELYRFGQHAFYLDYGLWRYTVDEQYDFVTTSEGILTEEDRAVPSEVGYKWINTFTVNRPKFRSEITGYVNYIDNYIFSKAAGITTTTRGSFIFNIYDQTNALFWGIDLYNEWNHSATFASVLKGSYLWSKQADDNDFFVGQPPAQINYALSYQPSISFLDKTEFEIGFNYTFEQWQHPQIFTVEEFLYSFQTEIDRFKDEAPDFDILPPPPGYFLTNFSWKSSYKKLNWQFLVRNIFNSSYRVYTDRLRYFADDLGRNFIFSLNYRI